MKWKLHVIFLVLLALILSSCRDYDTLNQTESALPYAVVYNNDNKENIILIDYSFHIMKKLTVGRYIEDMDIFNNKLYLIDTGTHEDPRKDLYQVDLKDFSIAKLVLPYIPHQIKISQHVAYISSVKQDMKKGFQFMIVDLTQFKMINSIYTPGMTSSLLEAEGKIYAALNTGGAANYGSSAKILQIELNSNHEVTTNNILKTEEELPPSWMTISDNSLYGVYPGFAYGPKPKWVTNPKAYTNKLKILDIQTGIIKKEIDLPHSFPQMMVIKKDNTAFINHYTNLDMTGENISILNLESNQIIGKITTPTPSFLAVDDENLLVTNILQDRLTVFDSNTWVKKKEIEVGKWPKKVLLVNQ